MFSWIPNLKRFAKKQKVSGKGHFFSDDSHPPIKADKKQNFHPQWVLTPSNKVAHRSILNKKVSNPMNVHEHFIRIGYYLSQIDKIINFLGHICII